MNPVFTNEDQLRLLQLTTRRQVAQRIQQVTDDADDELVGSEGEVETSLSTDQVSEWRLIPESVILHRWQTECLPMWLRRGRGTIKIATGGGKTLFALAAAQQLQNEQISDLRLVIVVPTIPLMYQWYDEIRNGNLPESAIGLMGGGQDLPQSSDLRILIAVLNSARERLPAFTSRLKWSDRMLLIVDECHRANAEQSQRIFDSNPRYTLGLSATPERELDDEGIPTDEAYEKSPIGQALGPIIFEFTIKDSLDAGLLTPFEVWHIGLPLTGEEAGEHSRLSREITELRKQLQIRYRKSRSKQGFLAWCQTLSSRGGAASDDAKRFVGLASQRKRLLYRATARTDISLAVLSESALDKESRAILFHESIQDIERIFLYAEAKGLPVVLEHSKLPDSLRAENIDAFRKGIARSIISAKSLVEGFNVPSADLGIIAASSGSVRQRIQSLGRMLRKKAGGRTARVIVLYVRDTEDETIYEKADWESIVGAERNRYFQWDPVGSDKSWDAGLQETGISPRKFRPPSWEVDVEALNAGDPYPGQTTGTELKVDQSGNLRTEDGVLTPCPPELVTEIIDRNPFRRAQRTPAGHLIVRVDSQGSQEADWRYLGNIELPEEPENAHAAIRLRIKSNSGRRVIAWEDESKKGVMRFALGPDLSRTPEGGAACDTLLAWISEVERNRGTTVKDLHWDQDRSYWLELDGERIPFEQGIAPLEFKQ